MNTENLKKYILENIKNSTNEVKRVFHGRGKYFEKYDYLNIDSIDKLLLISLYEEISEDSLSEIKTLIFEILKFKNYEIVLIQHRYKKNDIYELIKGDLPKEWEAIENGLKYKLYFKNQNIGLFFDMKAGRKYINDICKNKNVLNLFSYTCSFSVSALSAGALKVVNVDMSKSALSIGRINHHINNLDTKKVKFMPYNILKSFSRIKKEAPYDVIIIDPPSFQKGSFSIHRDYEKILNKIPLLASNNCTILACINDPKIDDDFLKGLFESILPSFKFIKRLKNPSEFPSKDEQSSLKSLVFKN